MTGCNDANSCALNPLNKIPTLVFEDGSTLCDSAMICDYLADTVPASTLDTGRMPRARQQSGAVACARPWADRPAGAGGQ